jgi:hypothetical protein
MHQIMDLTYRNSLMCPAVARVVERMKVGWGKCEFCLADAELTGWVKMIDIL